MAFPPIPPPTQMLLAFGRPRSVALPPGRPGPRAFVIVLDPEGAIAHVNPDGTVGEPDPATKTPDDANFCTPGGLYDDPSAVPTVWPDGQTIAIFTPVQGHAGVAVGLMSTGGL